jgi:hypothetical protein
VVATDDVVLEEMKNSDERVLSMQAAANERNSISYTLSSSIHENPYHVEIVSRSLTQQLYRILPDIVEELSWTFGQTSTISNEWTRINAYPLMLKCISASTNRILVGRTLARDQEYLESLMKLSRIVSRAGLVIDLAPHFLKAILAFCLVPKSGPLKTFLAKLGPVFEERRAAIQKLGDGWRDKPVCQLLSFRSDVGLTCSRLTLFNGSLKLLRRILRYTNSACVFYTSTSQRFTPQLSA